MAYAIIFLKYKYTKFLFIYSRLLPLYSLCKFKDIVAVTLIKFSTKVIVKVILNNETVLYLRISLLLYRTLSKQFLNFISPGMWQVILNADGLENMYYRKQKLRIVGYWSTNVKTVGTWKNQHGFDEICKKCKLI